MGVKHIQIKTNKIQCLPGGGGLDFHANVPKGTDRSLKMCPDHRVSSHTRGVFKTGVTVLGNLGYNQESGNINNLEHYLYSGITIMCLFIMITSIWMY